MQYRNDGRGQRYFDIENVRITLVIKPDGWAGDGTDAYLRFQTYLGDPGRSRLLRGAELPIRNADDVLALLYAIVVLTQDNCLVH